MALYTRESRDAVRDAVDFVELVGARTELRRAGPARYEGLCPFHDERTPSFGIDPAQKVYYCFGCQASGDLFTFVQESEGVDFKGALELLAERYGVELQREKEDPREAEQRRERERLLELLSRTADYYQRYLWESKEAAHAREYLAGRGLGEEILREFRVGYSPSAWDTVLKASSRGGFSAKDLYAVGLAQRSGGTGRVYDRFRSRIMFPLADVRGKVLGFGARALDHDEDSGSASDRRRPKYLNTSEGEIYHKGRQLYGADLARVHATRAGEVILCEGYTDVIALHQAGMRNAVGLMGTALTADQVGELARMAQTVLLSLDADTAGQEAMLKASALAAKRKLELRVVPMPSGADPAELIQREGAEAMAAAVARSVPFVRFRVERELDGGDERSAEGRDRIIEALRPVFATLPPSAMRMELTGMVSSRLALPESLAEQMLSEAGPARSRPEAPSRDRARAAEPAGARNGGTARERAGGRRDDPERAFLALCIASPEEGEAALAAMDVEGDFSSDLLVRAARRLREGDLRAPMADRPGGAALDEDQELLALLAELIVQAAGEEHISGMLEEQRLQLELARVDRQIQQARGREDADVNALARQKIELKAEFNRAHDLVLEQTGGKER